MSDLIERQAAIDALAEHEKSGGHNYTLFVDIVSECAEIIRDLPSAQPDRKRGRWIRNDNGTYSCSVCQSWIPEEQHHYARYCLYCGADMRGE